MSSKVLDEITCPFPNRWSLGMDNYFHPKFYDKSNYFSMLGLKLIPVSKQQSTSDVVSFIVNLNNLVGGDLTCHDAHVHISLNHLQMWHTLVLGY